MIRLRKEDCEGLLIDKEQISFIEILTKHIMNININLNMSQSTGYPLLRPDTRQNQ